MDGNRVVIGIEDDHLEEPGVPSRTDDEQPIALSDRAQLVADGVANVFIGDSVLPSTVRDLHYGNLACRPAAVNIYCRVALHHVAPAWPR